MVIPVRIHREAPVVSRLLNIAKVASLTLFWLLIFDLVGAVVSFVLDVLESEDGTRESFYLIWFILGVYCGMLTYQGACGMLTYQGASESLRSGGGTGGTSREGAIGTGRLVLSTMLVVLVALLVAGYRYLWPAGSSAYVPDSESLTITFFVGIALSSAFWYRVTQTE
jgi:hypothetical protein